MRARSPAFPARGSCARATSSASSPSGVGRGQGRARAQGDVAGKRDVAGQCRDVRAHARRQDHRHGDRRLGRCGESFAVPRMWHPRATAGPYQSHAPFAANCAIADVGPNGALVMCSTQDIYDSRAKLAKVHGVPVGRTASVLRRLRHVRPQLLRRRGASRGGHVAAVGKPVRVQFMRADEHGWDNYGPAHFADVRVGLDAEGKLVAYEYDGWQHGWMVAETSQELALQPRRRSARQAPAPSP